MKRSTFLVSMLGGVLTALQAKNASIAAKPLTESSTVSADIHVSLGLLTYQEIMDSLIAEYTNVFAAPPTPHSPDMHFLELMAFNASEVYAAMKRFYESIEFNIPSTKAVASSIASASLNSPNPTRSPYSSMVRSSKSESANSK